MFSRLQRLEGDEEDDGVVDLCAIEVPEVPENEEGFQRVSGTRRARKEKKRFCGEIEKCGKDDCQEVGCCGAPQEVEICLGEVDPSRVSKLGVTFQVTGVKKPLMLVWKVVQKGNKVCFGPSVSDNYIEKLATKKRFPLVSNGKGSYLLHVDFENGKQTAITIGSGAEDSVCPRDWGAEFGITEGKKIMFKDASGNIIPHFGQRRVKVVAPF